MIMKVTQRKTLVQWSRAIAFSLPVLAAQVVLPQLAAPVVELSFGVANAAEEKKPKQKTKRTQAISQKVYKKLEAAQEAIEAKNYSEAKQIFAGLKSGKKPLNDFEMASVLNLEAFIAYAHEDYKSALVAYKKITTLEQAPEGTVIQARYSVAQLYFVTEQWAEGVAALKDWFKYTQMPTASAYVMLAQGQYQLKKFDDALSNVDKAVSMYKEKGKVPKENWYGLQRFLYYEKNNYKKVVSILEELLVHYPKKQYWLQLSAMQAELKSDSKQLAAMETAYMQGMLEKDRELVNMAYLFLANETPYRAAKVLEKGMKEEKIEPTAKNLELLGNSLRSAQEIKRAIPVMAKAAAKSDKGELWARLGNIYLDNDDFKNAVKAVNAGLKKGGVKRPDTANLVLGMAHFNLKQYDSARKAFNKSKKDKRSKKYAVQWINFMDKELERQRSLRES